jgi:hypothetical protein
MTCLVVDAFLHSCSEELGKVSPTKEHGCHKFETCHSASLAPWNRHLNPFWQSRAQSHNSSNAATGETYPRAHVARGRFICTYASDSLAIVKIFESKADPAGRARRSSMAVMRNGAIPSQLESAKSTYTVDFLRFQENQAEETCTVTIKSPLMPCRLRLGQPSPGTTISSPGALHRGMVTWMRTVGSDSVGNDTRQPRRACRRVMVQ